MKPLSTYAPGRAELLGNHTDYNEGYVLAIAVNCGTTLMGTTPRGSRALAPLARAQQERGNPARSTSRRKGRRLVTLHPGRGGRLSPPGPDRRRIRRGDHQHPADGRGPEQQRVAGKCRRAFPPEGLRRIAAAAADRQVFPDGRARFPWACAAGCSTRSRR